jgi:hypothetical protein
MQPGARAELGFELLEAAEIPGGIQPIWSTQKNVKLEVVIRGICATGFQDTALPATVATSKDQCFEFVGTDDFEYFPGDALAQTCKALLQSATAINGKPVWIDRWKAHCL